jgi:hypothetical protein
MLAKSRYSTFINDLIIEVKEALVQPISVALRNEDGKICCKAEKKICALSQTFKWEGLNDLPYGVYMLECSQGNEMFSMRIVKRV